jgi:hypothetical protein
MIEIACGNIVFKNLVDFSKAKSAIIKKGFSNERYWLESNGKEMFLIEAFQEKSLTINLPQIRTRGISTLVLGIIRGYDVLPRLAVLLDSEMESLMIKVTKGKLEREDLGGFLEEHREMFRDQIFQSFLFSRIGLNRDMGFLFESVAYSETVKFDPCSRDNRLSLLNKLIKKGHQIEESLLTTGDSHVLYDSND